MTSPSDPAAARAGSAMRFVALALLLLWSAAIARRTVLNERRIGSSVADPYSTHAIIGLAPHGRERPELVPALRRLADAAGDRHDARVPALVLLSVEDTASVTFVLYQLAHLWYPQLVEVRAGADSTARPTARGAGAFVYVHERYLHERAGAGAPLAPPGDSVAAVPGFVARRVAR